MSETKTNLILIITMFLIGMCVTGGTYAYWTWNSTQTKNVIFNVGNLSEHVIYNEGESRFAGDFRESDNFCGGLSNTISFYKKDVASNVKIVATINMDVNRIESPIANSSQVYWVLTEGGSEDCVCSEEIDPSSNSSIVSSGSFNGVAAGSTIVLNEYMDINQEIELVTTEEKYTIWIWVSEMDGLSGSTLDTNIWTQFDLVDSES